jgi:F-box/leucine-rich repeat protein 2/20
MESVPDELLLQIFSCLGGRTLLVSVPHVSRRWRGVCQRMLGVHFDLTWCTSPIPQGGLAWFRGLFPHADSVTLGVGSGLTDAMVSELPALKSACLYDCDLLTKLGTRQLAVDSPDLHTLDLSWCNLTDGSVYSVYSLRHLVSVSFYQCHRLTDQFVRHLVESCAHLEDLNLGYCNALTDYSGIGLAQPGIVRLFLEGCRFTDATLFALAAGCPALSKLALGGNENLTDVGIGELARMCVRLTDLGLEGCTRVTDLGIERVASIRNGCLEVINLDGVVSMTNGTLGALCKNHPELAMLDLTDHALLDDAGIEHFHKLGKPYVEKLTLGGLHQLTDLSLCTIRQFCNLSTFNGSGCVLFTDAGVCTLFHGCALLDSVVFDGCKLLTDAAFASVAVWCPDLNRVSLRDLQITSGTLSVLARLDRLMIIDVGGCTKVDDAGVWALATGCRFLEAVGFAKTAVTDKPLIALANPRITVVDISFAAAVSDAAVIALCNHGRLTEFRAEGCSLLTDASCAALATNRMLNTLVVNGCVLLTQAGLDDIASGCSRLDEFTAPSE